MGFPRFTIRRGMAAVAIFSVALTLPPTMLMAKVLSLLAISAAVISQLPYRIRLAIEVTLLLILLAFSAWTQQSQFYAREADRTWELASETAAWAATSKSVTDRAILRRESAWFARRSVSLRCRGMWKGLFHGPSFPAGNRQENRYALDLTWEIKGHEDAARQAHRPSRRGR